MGSDNSIANTARVSMETLKQWHLLPNDYSIAARNKLLQYLADNHHTSPFRHTHLSIQCVVPMFIARQLGKHQVGLSWNETSRRYSTDEISFFTPEAWRAKPDKSIKQGSGDVMSDEDQAILNDLHDHVIDTCVGVYDTMIEMGVAPELARMELPQSMNIPYVWSGSLMAFAHVFNLRYDGHAQKEAQDFAKQLDTIIEPLFPVSWKVLTRREVV